MPRNGKSGATFCEDSSPLILFISYLSHQAPDTGNGKGAALCECMKEGSNNKNSEELLQILALGMFKVSTKE